MINATDSQRVLVLVPAFNAGDTTRGIETARAIERVAEQRGRAVEVQFVHTLTTQSFEQKIADAGFHSDGIDLGLTDDEVATIMRADHDGTEFITDPARAREILQALVELLRERRPDAVVYGFLPPAGIAASIVGIPSVTYVPFPVHRPWVQRHFLRTVPDEFDLPGLADVPARVRRRIGRVLSSVVVTTGFFRQPTLARAGRELGWTKRPATLFGQLDADLQLVNDLPSYYAGQEIGPRTEIAGPLYSRSGDAPVPADIAAHFAPDDRPRVFVSMGSSGEKPFLLAAIEGVGRLDCRAVVVVLPHVASLPEARAALEASEGPADVLFTDAFVPARSVNALADVAVIHGGQGTVQTAVQAGTPVVGVGMQWEQAGNLDRLVAGGSAIRIPRQAWAADAVESALRTVTTDPSYARAARSLQAELLATDGYQNTGDLIWDRVLS